MVDLSDPAQAKLMADAASEILEKTDIYKDALQPVAKEVGKSLQTLGGVVNLALEPLRGMVLMPSRILCKEEPSPGGRF